MLKNNVLFVFIKQIFLISCLGAGNSVFCAVLPKETFDNQLDLYWEDYMDEVATNKGMSLSSIERWFSKCEDLYDVQSLFISMRAEWVNCNRLKRHCDKKYNKILKRYERLQQNYWIIQADRASKKKIVEEHRHRLRRNDAAFFPAKGRIIAIAI